MIILHYIDYAVLEKEVSDDALQLIRCELCRWALAPHTADCVVFAKRHSVLIRFMACVHLIVCLYGFKLFNWTIKLRQTLICLINAFLCWFISPLFPVVCFSVMSLRSLFFPCFYVASILPFIVSIYLLEHTQLSKFTHIQNTAPLVEEDEMTH